MAGYSLNLTIIAEHAARRRSKILLVLVDAIRAVGGPSAQVDVEDHLVDSAPISSRCIAEGRSSPKIVYHRLAVSRSW